MLTTSSPYHMPPPAAPQDALYDLFQRQCSAHASDSNPSLATRLDRLSRLERLLHHYGDAFSRSISADFGNRSTHETQMAELLGLHMNLANTRRHLPRWMKPRRMATALPYWPAHNRLLRQPLGVVGVIAPWNYPLQLALSPALAALAAGNHVMIKPSELTPRFSAELNQAVEKFFGNSEMAVVQGDADTGRAFAALPFNHLFFTGSTRVGRLVAAAAAANLTPVTLELGGKSPAIVDASADLEHAATRIAFGKLLNAGQTCVAPDYVLIHTSQVQEFGAAFARAAARLYPSFTNNPDYTSIIHPQHFQRLTWLLEDARQRGATVQALGETDAQQRILPAYLVFQPTPDMELMQEEIFGPILPIVPYDSTEQALQFINSRPHPLALYWFGTDKERQQQVLQGTLSGGVTINDCIYHIVQESQPFGGVGASGMGHYHGEWGFRTFSKEKPVFIQSRLSGTRLLLPPYGAMFDRVMRVVRSIAG